MRLLFWSNHIREVLLPEIEMMLTCLEKRLLPTFSNIDKEAREIQENTLQHVSSLVGPDSDPGSIAEQARDEGISYYIRMKGIEQGILNLFAAACHHLFEQQFKMVCRDLFLTDTEESKGGILDFKVGKERLKEIGIDLSEFGSWSKVNELRLVANVTKHAEGSSAKELREINPSLFRNPILEKFGPILIGKRRSFLSQPLMGEDFFVTLEILKTYTQAIALFWNELAQRLQSHPSVRVSKGGL